MESKSLMFTCPSCNAQTLYRMSGSYRVAIKTYHDHQVQCPKCGHSFFAQRIHLVPGVVRLDEEMAS
jgi:predicted RNA-binding Zn-ribbon protein involved in translation (DUF1610 family)